MVLLNFVIYYFSEIDPIEYENGGEIRVPNEDYVLIKHDFLKLDNKQFPNVDIIPVKYNEHCIHCGEDRSHMKQLDP